MSLIEGRDGRVRAGVRVEGTLASLTIPSGILEQSGCLGVFHTHPVAAGSVGQALSWPDFRFVFRKPLPLMIVQSGNHRFLVGKPADFAFQNGEAELELLFSRWLAAAWSNSGVTQEQALLGANLRLCSRVGLSFYYGSDRLRRLAPDV
jgi:hypothetical protein